MLPSVYITKLAKFLPNEPVSNDEMEDYLGKINNKPSMARRIVLRNNGIKTRHYALDKLTGLPTHSNALLTSEAVKRLITNGISINDIEMLACGTGTSDQILPSHAAMVHGILGGTQMEISSFQGACCTGMQSLKLAYLSILSGNTKNAIATGSERVSSWMLAKNFQSEAENLNQLEQNPYLAFEKEFLRWMLSDGAGAALLEAQPNSNGLSLKIEWIENRSYAHELEPCMYSGCEKEGDQLKGWSEFDSADWLCKSIFAIKQDVKILSSNIIKKGGEFLLDVVKKRKLDVSTIDYYLPHLSSCFFMDKMVDEFEVIGLSIPVEKWFMNLSRVGNVGSASPYLMLEELFNSNKLKKGDRILLMAPESARFSYSFALFTVC